MSNNIKICYFLQRYFIIDLCYIILDYNAQSLYTIINFSSNSNFNRIIKSIIYKYIAETNLSIEYKNKKYLNIFGESINPKISYEYLIFETFLDKKNIIINTQISNYDYIYVLNVKYGIYKFTINLL